MFLSLLLVFIPSYLKCATPFASLTYISNCLLAILTWMAHGHLEHIMSQTVNFLQACTLLGSVPSISISVSDTSWSGTEGGKQGIKNSCFSSVSHPNNYHDLLLPPKHFSSFFPSQLPRLWLKPPLAFPRLQQEALNWPSCLQILLTTNLPLTQIYLKIENWPHRFSLLNLSMGLSLNVIGMWPNR